MKKKKIARVATNDMLKDHYCQCGKFGSFGKKGKVSDNGHRTRTIWRCFEHRGKDPSSSEGTQDLFG